MRKSIFYLFLLVAVPFCGFSQVTIATWESGTSPTFTGYPIEVNATRMSNPSKTGINTSDSVEQLTSLSGNKYELAYTNPVLSYISFTNVNTISVKVFSTVAGKVRLQLEKSGDGSRNKYVDAYYFTPGAWQELKFNFYFTSANNGWYNIIVIMPDVDNNTRSNNWCFDDIKTIMSTSFTDVCISNFNDTIRSFEPKKGSQDAAYPVVEYVTDPIDGDNHVMKFVTDTAKYEGTMCLMESTLDFTNKNSISVKVYSSVSGRVWLKISDYDNESNFISIPGYYFTPGYWQEIKFNLYCTAGSNDMYNAITVFPDYDGTTPDKTWYFDDFKFVNSTPISAELLTDFEGATVRSFEGKSGSDVPTVPAPAVTYETDPTDSGGTNHVMMFKTDTTHYEGAATVLESTLDFTGRNTISVKVYSEHAGKVWLKASDFHNEVNQTNHQTVASGYYFTPGNWQEIKFNLYCNADSNDLYDMITIYPDYYGTGADQTWNFDDFKFLNSTPITAELLTDFEGATVRSFEGKSGSAVPTVPAPAVTYETDPTDSGGTNHVMMFKTDTTHYEGAATVLESTLDFTGRNTISVKVYSGHAGKVWLKASDFHNEVNQTNHQTVASGYYFTPGNWQEIKFNLYCNADSNDLYDMITIYPDYYGTGADQTWNFDDFKFLNSTPITAELLTDFEGATVRSFEGKSGSAVPTVPAPAVTYETDPTDSGGTNHVMMFKTDTTNYEGAATVLESTLDFTDKNSISVLVYSASAGKLALKASAYNNETKHTNHQTVAYSYYFKPNEWQEIKFNLDCPADSNGLYDMVTIYPDYEGATPDKNCYFDDFKYIYIPPFKDDIISNFDDVTRNFEDYTVNGISFPFDNPKPDDVNGTAKCLKVRTDVGKYENIKVNLESKFDFSTYRANQIKLLVYSEVSGKIFMKLVGTSPAVEKLVDANYYSTPLSWQELTFDISGLPSNTYNSIVIFPDFEGTGVKDWYIDEVIQYHPIDINTYSNWEDKELTFTAIGNSSTGASVDPVDADNHVLSITTTSQTSEGAKTTLDKYMDYTVSAIYKVNVYSTATGQVKMKLEGTGITEKEVTVNYSTSNQWEILTFDFGLSISSDVYNVISILPDFGGTANGTWYIDELSGPSLVVAPVTLGAVYADWETVSPTVDTWNDLATSVVLNPFVAGINQSGHALGTNTNEFTYEGFKFTIQGVFDFSTGTSFALNVRASQPGQVLFKLESSFGPNPVEISKQYTKAGSWQQLVFTFNENLPSAYNTIAIFPDFGGQAVSQWHFDNIQGPISIERLIFLTGLVAENREDGKVVSVNLIGDSYVSSLTTSSWTITGLPSGVTIGSVARINDTVAEVTFSGNSTGQSADDITFTLTVNKNQFVSNTSDLAANMQVVAIGGFSETRQKRVFVHYMPWYNIDAAENLPEYGMWRKGVDHLVNYSNSPLIGEYSQIDEDVLEYHYLTMHAAGIDGIIININPSAKSDVVRTMSILNKLAGMNQQYASSGFSMKYLISYDNQYLNPRDYASIYNELKQVRDSLINNPLYSAYRFNDDKTGYPVVITWSHLNDQDTSYHKALNELYNGGVIHMKRDAADFASGDATFEWINYLKANTSPTEHEYWGEDFFADFEASMATQQKTYIPANQRVYLTMGAVWPGFDDRNAAWGMNRWINRTVDDGETMALTFDKHINYVPATAGPVKVEKPWLQVVTWNDWPEGATIEPASEETYGYTALLTTMVKTAEFKGQATPGNADSIAVTIPYAIYQARKSGNNGLALCIIDQFLAGNYTTALNTCNSGYTKFIPVTYIPKENANYSGAACAKMILDFEGTNITSQAAIQMYGVAYNYSTNIGQDFIDPNGMYEVLNNYEVVSAYNYSQYTETTQAASFNDMCYWMSYDVPNVDVSKMNMPAVVPTGGNFNNWMVVNGFRASGNPHSGSYTVYGFYVMDPSLDGIGQNMFIQATPFGSSYFKPIISSDIWNGKYVSVVEPPVNNQTITIQALQPYKCKPTTNTMRFSAAEEGLKNSGLLLNDANAMVAMKNAKRGRIYFVNLPGRVNDYYIVTFEKDGGCVVATIIDANNGALKEVSFAATPDKAYYTNLYKVGTRLKSASEEVESYNSFYPLADNVTTIEEGIQNQASDKGFNFEIGPNPSSDFTLIQYVITDVGLVNLSIIDLSGKTIKTIVNTRQNIGDYNLKINVQDMQNGVYLVKLISGNKKCTKLLIINK